LLSLHEAIVDPATKPLHVAAEDVVVGSAAEPLHDAADPTVVGVALTKTSCLCVQI
jgi:hypothetical protein